MVTILKRQISALWVIEPMLHWKDELRQRVYQLYQTKDDAPAVLPHSLWSMLQGFVLRLGDTRFEWRKIGSARADAHLVRQQVLQQPAAQQLLAWRQQA